MKGFCYTSHDNAIDKKFSDTLWSKYQDWEQDVPAYSELRLRFNCFKILNEHLVTPLHVIARASYGSHMRSMFEQHLKQDYPAHVRQDMRAVFNCLHNYQLFHHAASDLDDVPLPNLVKQRVPGGNVQVFQDIPGGNIQVTYTVQL